jgi:hypothetical protein
MKANPSVKIRGGKIESIEVGSIWTRITIKVRTDSITAQGSAKILPGKEGKTMRRKIRRISPKP